MWPDPEPDPAFRTFSRQGAITRADPYCPDVPLFLEVERGMMGITLKQSEAPVGVILLRPGERLMAMPKPRGGKTPHWIGVQRP